MSHTQRVKSYMSKQLRVRGCRKSEAANRRTDQVVTVLTAVDTKIKVGLARDGMGTVTWQPLDYTPYGTRSSLTGVEFAWRKHSATCAGIVVHRRKTRGYVMIKPTCTDH